MRLDKMRSPNKETGHKKRNRHNILRCLNKPSTDSPVASPKAADAEAEISTSPPPSASDHKPAESATNTTTPTVAETTTPTIADIMAATEATLSPPPVPEQLPDALPDTAPKGSDLKRIGFVETTASAVYDKATSLAYSVAKAAPTPVANVANSTYETISPTVEPYATKAIEILKPTASNILVTVDGKVDEIIKYGEGMYSSTAKSYESYKELLADGTKQFQERFDTHFKAIDEFLQSLKGRLHLPSSQEAADLVSEKLAELSQMLGNASQAPREAVVAKVGQLQAAWEALLERQEVVDAIKYSNSSIETVKTRINAVHDTVVADPRYSTLWDTTESWLSWAQNTALVSKAMSYAMPVANRLAATSYAEKAKPYASSAYEWVKPAPALEGIETK